MTEQEFKKLEDLINQRLDRIEAKLNKTEILCDTIMVEIEKYYSAKKTWYTYKKDEELVPSSGRPC
jgi:hypothetical protein